MFKIKSILFVLLSSFSIINASIPMHDHFKGPTEQLVKRESWGHIESKLHKMKISSQYFPLFETISSDEDWGHIGYHGAAQGYRIYQDIIKMVVEEVLQIPVREDFQFLRIPGDSDLNLNSIDEFADFWGKLNNHGKKGKQLLSLNFGIYSNFDVPGSSSLNFFVHDYSKGHISLINELKPFFEQVGLNPSAVSQLFNLASNRLSDEGGVLLKISETSHLTNPNHKAYNHADILCYPCKRGGYAYGHSSFSNHMSRLMTSQYTEGDIDIAPQFRLLINNKVVLNPYSDFHIMRWDLYDTETIANYEKELRAAIKKLKSNPAKADAYRNKLLNLWQVEL